MSGRYFESSVMSIDQIQCSQYAYWIKIFDEYILLMLRRSVLVKDYGNLWFACCRIRSELTVHTIALLVLLFLFYITNKIEFKIQRLGQLGPDSPNFAEATFDSHSTEIQFRLNYD